MKTDESTTRGPGEKSWRICGEAVPSEEVVFFTQTIILYVVIAVCLVNLSIGSENESVFIGLLSSSLGYMLPNPTLGKSIPTALGRGIEGSFPCFKNKGKVSDDECSEVLSGDNVIEESVNLSNTLDR